MEEKLQQDEGRTSYRVGKKKINKLLKIKKTDTVMWKEKEGCWERLISEFNNQALLRPRTVVQLQLKYQSLNKVL